KIDPFFPKNRPLIVTEFPASQAALSTIGTTPSGNSFARRFEVFMGGLEIANAFHELTDPTLQRKRFKKDMDLRSETYGETLPKTPIEEDFLEAVEKLPPCAGIAVGIDRLVMLLANEPEIQYLKWLPHF
ncbi:MAG: EF-P lysine aminoacylase GenX, partial [Bdellovibrionaceae bacterium]|nr:EF-P lysine aminoacylase GenX [Pseudobdellovibrionaceae bacterium]